MKERATIVCTRSGRVLLVTRGNGRWALPGGTIRRSELPAEAARRELVEETGLAAGRLAFLFMFGGLRKRHHVFHLDVPRAATPRPGNEIVDCLWLHAALDPPVPVSVPTREIMRLFVLGKHAGPREPAVRTLAAARERARTRLPGCRRRGDDV